MSREFLAYYSTWSEWSITQLTTPRELSGEFISLLLHVKWMEYFLAYYSTWIEWSIS
jgi:hypothetical protein